MIGTQVMSRTVGPSSRNLQLRLQAKPMPPIPKDIVVDQWASMIFSIISSGPAGGFVRFGISPRNELYVDKTGNRSLVEEVVSELLPQDVCRFVAYKLKYRRYGNDHIKVVWFVWSKSLLSANWTTGLPHLDIGLVIHSWQEKYKEYRQVWECGNFIYTMLTFLFNSSGDSGQNSM